MIARLILFAAAKEIVGKAEMEVTLDDPATVADLKKKLIDDFPSLKPLLARSALAVNHRYATDDERLPHGVEVGLIPPVSGG